MTNHISIYTEKSSPRLHYTADFLLNELLGLDFSFIFSMAEFNSCSGPKINYSISSSETSSLQIIPSGLLGESGIRPQEIRPGMTGSIPTIFNTEGVDRFDIFSAVFYMLSRYEEYLPFTADRYGRFQSSDSLAYKNGFLMIPVVNVWANHLGVQLKDRFHDLSLKPASFGWLNTFDIDRAWAFRNRNFLSTAGIMIKSLFKGNDFFYKAEVLRGDLRDPFFTFDLIGEIHSGEAEKLMFFILSGKPGGADINTNPANEEWQELVRHLSNSYKTGIHPSLKSNRDLKILQSEKHTLENITSRKITDSRQHFLILNFPQSYRNLISAGIENDYSMVFADRTGFRAGTSTPFYFYDLAKEEKTSLKVFPLASMDRTLLTYMKLDPQSAIEQIASLIKVIRSSGGMFISLWHNEALSDYGEWKGWRKVYTSVLEILTHQGDQ